MLAKLIKEKHKNRKIEKTHARKITDKIDKKKYIKQKKYKFIIFSNSFELKNLIKKIFIHLSTSKLKIIC